jgi:rfaE bifunctional protein nucleotidyltransferase chain/domain/rfaE bifunctional protein kinase chain/domain
MIDQLLAVIGERGPRVLVIGDVLLDVWLTGTVNRVGREAPVPVVEVTERRVVPGGAANTAVSLTGLGARAALLGVAGDDAEGGDLRAELTRAGVAVDGLLTGAGLPTVVKQRVCCGDTVLGRCDRPGPDRLPAALAAALAGAVADALTGPAPPDAVLVADYDAGGVPDEVLAVLSRERPRIGLLVVDARRPDRWAPTRPDVATPNAAEAAGLLGLTLADRDRVSILRGRRAELVERSGAGAVLVTLDRDGALWLPADPRCPDRHVGTRPAPDSHACGAGDVLAATLTAALACGAEPVDAVRLAQAGAEAAIAGAGAGATTVRVTAEAQAGRLSPPRPAPLTRAELAAVVAEHRRAGRRIVFTNGCFDVLHRGHVAYLEQARRLGDVLIVALNSDASVARLKGPDRPVNPEADRASVMAALRCVDHVVIFSEDTPISLLELVRPEVYAKGGDYTPQMLPETPVVRRLGGEVRVLDYLSDHSTSAIVRRIRDRAVS